MAHPLITAEKFGRAHTLTDPPRHVSVPPDQTMQPPTHGMLHHSPPLPDSAAYKAITSPAQPVSHPVRAPSHPHATPAASGTATHPARAMPKGSTPPSLGRDELTALTALHTPPLADRRRWYHGNFERLNGLLAGIPRTVGANAAHAASPARTAAFDCDNTLIFSDISFNVLHFLLENMLIRLTRADVVAIVPDTIRGKTCVQVGTRSVALADIRADLLESFDALYPNDLLGGLAPTEFVAPDTNADISLEFGQSMTFHEPWRESIAHQNFRAKLLWLYDALEGTPGFGPEVAHPWLTTLFAGFNHRDLMLLTRDVVGFASALPITQTTWTSATPQRTGIVSVEMTVGLRRYDELLDLMHAMRERGIHIVVISGSEGSLVEGVLRSFGYPVDPANIHGMKLKVDADGIKLPISLNNPDTGGICHHRQGKALVLKQIVGDQRLLFAAGDTDNDLGMFDLAETCLIVRRNNKGSDIEALAQHPPPGGRVLVQGIDKTRGTFRDSQETLERTT